MIGLNPLTTFAPGVQNRFPNVVFIGGDDASVFQLHWLAEQPNQIRSAALRIGAVAGGAAQLLKNFWPVDAIDPAAPPPLSQASYCAGSMHDHLSDHSRVLRCRNIRRRTDDTSPALVGRNQAVV